MILRESMLITFKKALKNNFEIFVLLLLFSPLFFYKFAQSSLVSWDEAWYAAISRNILETKDFFNLYWNGLPFSDKPPGGFWIEALSFKIFGISEFGARLPSAVAGFLSVLLIYLLATKLFNKLTGILSAIALVSSTWFLYRSRVGDLDTLLVFFYLLTVYLAVLTVKERKYLIPFSLSLAFLPMIKGIIFLPSILPSLVIIFWGSKILKKRDFLVPVFFLSILFGGWILIQYIQSPELVKYHFEHSFRDSSLKGNFIINFKLFREYLHNGIGRWFWPGVLGVGLGLILRDKRLLFLSFFCFFYSIQFQFSSKVEIWHLIPLYPFMILSFFGSVCVLSERFFKQKLLINILLITFTLYFSFLQIRQMWYGFIDIPRFISDDAILSKEAGKYPYPFYIDSSFEPTAVFYSHKNTKWQNEYEIVSLFQQKQPFLLIVKQFMLDKLNIDKKDYKILKIDRDKILILYQPMGFSN